MNKIILASSSPRRVELINYISDNIVIHPSNVDEKIDELLSPIDMCIDLAKQKALDVASLYENDFVIGADTIVLFNNRIYGKPKNRQDAFNILSELSGKTHQVVTAMCIVKNNVYDTIYNITDVTFYPLTERDINDYLDINEYVDKAGAYGYQGHGFRFVEKINGDFYNVIGLPIGTLRKKLEELGYYE